MPGTRCPECGDRLALRLGLAEPRIGTLVAGLIGLSAGAGLNGLLLVYLAVMVSTRNRGGPDVWQFGTVNGCGFLVEGLAVAAWLTRWPWVRRTGPGVRAALVAACWMLTLANITVFSFTIR